MNTRHIKTLSLCSLFVFALVAGPLALSSYGEEPVLKLKFSSLVSASHPANKVFEQLCKDLTETSGGKVAVEFYPVNALGTPVDQLEITVDGMADISPICCGYTSSLFPLSTGTHLPFFADSAVMETKILAELLKRGIINSEYKDVEYLFPNATSPSKIFSNKKVSKVDDFKGLRMWGDETVMRDLCEELGCSVTTLPVTDVYLALQRKTLDAGANSYMAAVIGYKWLEVTKFVTDITLVSGWNCFMGMNKASWNKVPEDVQKKWKEEIFPKYSIQISAVFDAMDVKAKEMAVGSGKVEIIQLSPEEEAILSAKALPVWQKWIERNGDKGKEFYRAYVDIMKGMGQPVKVKVPGLYQE